MTDKLKQALEEAIKVEETFGLNVRGQSLALIELACEEYDNPDGAKNNVDILSTLWDDVGSDYIHREFLGSEGHMSTKDIAILKESSRELIDVVLAECATWNDIHEALKEGA